MLLWSLQRCIDRLKMNFGTNLTGRAIFVDYNNYRFQSPLKKDEDEAYRFPKRYAAKRLRTEINNTLKQAEVYLNAKKERLKDLLEREAAAFDVELQVLKTPKFRERRYEPEEVVEVPAEPIESKEELPHKLIDTDKFDVLSKELNRRKEVEVQKALLAQIEEKMHKIQLEKQAEHVWHEMMINDVQIRKNQEQASIEKSLRKIQDTRDFLNLQVIQANQLKKKKEVEERQIELEKSIQSLQLLNDDLKQNKKQIFEKKALLRAELLKQIEINQNIRDKEKEEVLQFERLMLAYTRNELKAIEHESLNKKDLKRQEIDEFNKHLMTLKSYRESCDKAYEESMLNLMFDKLVENEEQINLLKKKRKELTLNAAQGRKVQIEEREQFKRELINQDLLEFKKRVEYENKVKEIEQLEKEELIKRKNIYKNFLDNQLRLLKTDKEKETVEMKKHHEMSTEDIKRLNEECVHAMNRKECAKLTHPFAKSSQD